MEIYQMYRMKMRLKKIAIGSAIAAGLLGSVGMLGSIIYRGAYRANEEMAQLKQAAYQIADTNKNRVLEHGEQLELAKELGIVGENETVIAGELEKRLEKAPRSSFQKFIEERKQK